MRQDYIQLHAVFCEKLHCPQPLFSNGSAAHFVELFLSDACDSQQKSSYILCRAGIWRVRDEVVCLLYKHFGQRCAASLQAFPQLVVTGKGLKPAGDSERLAP